MHYAVTLNAMGDFEGAARVLIAAFLPAEYYGNPDYQRAVVEALRGMPESTRHQGLQTFVGKRGQWSDAALFQAFQTFKAQRLPQRH